MNPGGGPTVALLLVRVASVFVPDHERTEWLREWEAELTGRWADRLSGPAGWASGPRLARTALGAFVDAWALRARSGAFGGLGIELRVAVRSLGRRPVFAGLVVGILALGIGANATLYSVARDQLLRPFPYPDADRVATVLSLRRNATEFSGNVAYPNMADLDETATSLSDLGVIRYWTPALTDVGDAAVLDGATVTSNFFRILAVEPGLGRFFAPEEQGTGREPVVVLSHGFWQSRYGAEPEVVGSTLTLNGTSYRVIGITGAEFEDPGLLGGVGSEPQVWRTVASPPSEWPRSGRSWKAIGRVRPGLEISEAQAELDGLMGGLARAYPDHNAGRTVRIVPLRDRIAGPIRSAVLLLLGGVVLLLLVATANLAGLLLGRVLERQREFVLMRALGASGWRVLRVGLAEVAILSVAGGLGGLGVTALLLRGIGRVAPTVLPRAASGGLDPTVIGFAALATALCALLFGLAPALHGTRAAYPGPRLQGGRGSSAGLRGNRFRRGLVVTQMALTTVLLVASGLMARSFQQLGQVDLGLDPGGVIAMPLHGSAWWDLSEDAARAQWQDVLDAVKSTPGVTSAGAMDYVPLGGDYSCDGIRRDDRPPPGAGEGRCAEVRVVLPATLQTLGISLVKGRHISRTDGPDAVPVAVIDQSLADALWPGEDPIGKRMHVHVNVHEVVGVVADMRHFGAGMPSNPMVYLHAPQEGWNGITRGLSVVFRTDGVPVSVTGAVRAAIAEVNPTIAAGEVVTLERLERLTLAGPRFRALLLSLFAGSALALSILGIGGVMAYSVAMRTREMGVRVALGARPHDVRAMVLREGVRLTALGVGVGLILALAVAGSLDSLLFEVQGRDPFTYGAALALVTAAGLVSCYLPARRASRVEPATVLTAE